MLWAVCTLWFIAVQTFAIIHLGTPVMPMELAGALAALGVGHGASLWMKADTEPGEH